jgi:uncharacterized membrane protein
MTIDTTRWSQAYLAELDRAAMALPADRRAELLAQISSHLDAELADATSDDEARAVMERLGEPADVVAEAAADLVPAPVAPRSPAAEIVALLLMTLGSFALPLIAPAAGVLVMRTTPRWTSTQVRRSWWILAVGLVAALGLVALGTVPDTSSVSIPLVLVLLLVTVGVGPAAALYAGTRPRN